MDLAIVYSAILISISTITTLIFVQVFKTVLNSILIKKFDTKTLFSDGDFPSSHTAVLVSFNIVFWYLIYAYFTNHPNLDMFSSVLIGLVLVLWSCYEIRDAMGVRLRVQEHAYAIRQIALSSKEMADELDHLKLVDDSVNSQAIEEEIDELLSSIKLKVGHLPHEVLGGIITGGFIGCIFVTAADHNFNLLYILSTLFITYIFFTIIIFVRKKNKMDKKFKN